MVSVEHLEKTRLLLLNLYNNAFYAVSERAKRSNTTDYQHKVEVHTRREADQVEIRVKDLSLSYDSITKGHGARWKWKV